MAKSLNLDTKTTAPAERDANLVVPSELTTTGDAGLPILGFERRSMFIYALHPESWQVVNGSIVPTLTQWALTEGVNGIPRAQMDQQNGRVRLDLGAFRNKLTANGWIVVPYDRAPNGKSYIQGVQSLSGRVGGQVFTAYISIFEAAFPGAAHTYRDLKALVAWQKSLIPLIGQPSPNVLQGLMSDYAKDPAAVAIIAEAIKNTAFSVGEVTDGGIVW